jgi:regulator of replication initiation timing
LTTQTKSKERSSAINTKIKTLIRPSSQGNNRIFESSVYLTDPISNTPFEFEVDWFKAVTEKIHQVGSSNSSIDKFHYSFQTTKEEKGTLRLQNSSLNRKIDIEKFKETENIAAVIIQACWRGFKARKFFKNQKKSNLLQKAEQKARNAIKEYEELKSQIQRLRKKQINNPG